jgi:hypothetical protein
MKWNGDEFTIEALIEDFAIKTEDLQGVEILFAGYEYENYSGSAFVLFARGEKLWEVNGSHCSCMGLENQWEPEETLADAIRMRYGDRWELGKFAVEIEVALKAWEARPCA